MDFSELENNQVEYFLIKNQVCTFDMPLVVDSLFTKVTNCYIVINNMVTIILKDPKLDLH